MKSKGRYLGAHMSLDGQLVIELAVGDIATEELESLKDELLTIELNKYKPRRSLSANGYLWSLCDQIAKAIGSDKETVYTMMLKEAGVFESYTCPSDALECLKSAFKLVERIDEWKVYDEAKETAYKMCEVHCYRGSHDYDTKEFSKLLDRTIQVANDCGIDTWDEGQVQMLLERWERDHRRESK